MNPTDRIAGGAESTLRLCDFLRRRKEEILALWEDAVARHPKAKEMPRPVLRDHVPDLLERIASLSDPASPDDEAHQAMPSRLAEIHAWSRLDAGFNLEEVAAEYSVLRQFILHVLESESRRLGHGELEFLNLAIDRAIVNAAESFAHSRQRLLTSLDRMSEIALAGETGLERVFHGFIRIMLETAAIDSVTLYVREAGHLRIRASEGTEETKELRVLWGEGFVGKIAESRKAALLRTDQLNGTRVLYGAPLLFGDEVVGVAEMGSRTAVEFSDDDKVLFRSMASRLAQVIANTASDSRERGRRAVVTAFAEASSVKEAGTELLRALGSEFDWDVGAFWMLDEKAQRLHCVHTWEKQPGGREAFLTQTAELSLDEGTGLPGAAWASGQAEWRGDLTAVTNYPRREAAGAAGLRSALAIPLIVGEKIVGVLEFYSSRPRNPMEDSVQITRQLAEQARVFAGKLSVLEALRASEQEKSAFIDTSLDSIVGMDGSGKVTLWNPASERMFGYSQEEALGRNMSELIIPERLREAHRKGTDRYLSTGQARILNKAIEIPALRRDGSEFVVELIVSHLPTRGPPTFAGFMRDITERVRAADHQRFLVEATRLLSSSLDYERVTRELAELVVPRLADWCAVDLLERGAIRRAAVAHQVPEKMPLVTQIAREYPQRPEDIVPTVIRTGEPMLVAQVPDELMHSIARDARHLELIRKLGVTSLLVVPLIARGVTLGALSLATTDASSRRLDKRDLEAVTDVAARAALAIDNARLYEEEQNAVRLRENVLAIVSHDLRNPLGAIAMSAAVVARNAAAGDERIRKHVETIQRASGRMEHLIRDLLDMASIQAGRLAVELKEEEAEAIVLEAFEMHAPLALEKGLKFDLQLRLDDVQVLCDRERILQVFTNLLGNAIKFCRPHERVELRAAVEEGEVRFEVADSGPGIAEDEFPHLFRPYWSAAQHATKGTGLGLYISKGIIEAHAGKIWATSRVAVGTTFFFTLPIATKP